MADTGSHITLRIHLMHSMPVDTLSLLYTLNYSVALVLWTLISQSTYDGHT